MTYLPHDMCMTMSRFLTRRSVICLTLSGCWLISTMPPALSEMGPNTSMVRTYAAVDSIPIVATAVPNRPSAFDAVSPAGPKSITKRISRGHPQISLAGMSGCTCKNTASPSLLPGWNTLNTETYMQRKQC